MNYENFKVEKRDNGVTVVRMDVAGESVNTLKVSFADEFGALLEELSGDRDTRAIVLASAKKNNFIAGADINMLSDAKSYEDGVAISERGQVAMDRIEQSSKPIVAAVHGNCLGGGLELALACHARICSNHKSTRLGLPEIQLGLLPGAGGTQRLPALIGVQQALDLLLTGRQIDSKRAKKVGVCDEVVPHAIIEDVASQWALRLTNKPRKNSSPLEAILDGKIDKDELQQLALEENPIGRKVLFDQARKQTLKKTRGNYPAAERILDVVKKGLASGRKAGLRAEREAFGELLLTPHSRELRQIFFNTQALKKDKGTDADVEPHPVDRVGMIGGGLDGLGNRLRHCGEHLRPRPSQRPEPSERLERPGSRTKDCRRSSQKASHDIVRCGQADVARYRNCGLPRLRVHGCGDRSRLRGSGIKALDSQRG